MICRLAFLLIICGEYFALDDDDALAHVITDSTTDKLTRKLDDMERQLSEMRDSIVLLRQESTELKNRVRRLELDNGRMEEDLSSPRKGNTTILRPRERQKKRASWIQKKNFTDAGNDSVIRSTNKRGSTNLGPFSRTGFTVHRYDQDTHLNTGQTVVFDVVVSNIGGAYNMHTGVFHANIRGIYVFYVNILCIKNREVKTELMRDGLSLTIQVCDGRVGNYANGSTMTVVELSAGSSVWVRVRYIDNNDVAALGHETSFSGFLLEVLDN